jgi:AraC family transcriptional regulator
MHKAETRYYYQNKLDILLDYIRGHLDNALSIQTLAEQSNISLFHFHRIIKAYLGEPLGGYINRLRLDTATKLIRYSEDSIADIASKIGYSDLQAFTKSFTREFGISPSEYLSNKEFTLNSTLDFRYCGDQIEQNIIHPKIKTLPLFRVASISTIGRYGGPDHDKAWQVLIDFAKKHKLLGWNTEAYSIYYDDPFLAGEENCRFDCCLTIKKEVESEGDVVVKQFEGGKCLLFRYKGPYEKLWEVYDKVYHDVIFSIGNYQLRDAPFFEKYVKYSDKTKPENLLTDIHIPVL